MSNLQILTYRPIKKSLVIRSLVIKSLMIKSLVIRSLIIGSLFSLAACNMPSTNTKASALLGAANEVPATTSNGTGDAKVAIDVKNNKINWTIHYNGLTGAVTAAHFHGPAAEGENTGVALPIAGDMLSPMKGESTVTEIQKADLLAGKWYINLHTAANPDGEIRGQVVVKK